LNEKMKQLGCTEAQFLVAMEEPRFHLGRILTQQSKTYEIILEEGRIHAEVSGKLRYEAKTLVDFPVVGDFVLVDRETSEEGRAVIHRVLPRKSLFLRKASGKTTEAQPVAANVDTLFLCMALNENYNVRRLERYFAVALESGAKPVFVLTKKDLAEDALKKVQEVEEMAMGHPVVVTSALREEGVEALKAYTKAGETCAFLGSSGVGKSTLMNVLLGENVMETKDVGFQDKGRHTTTHRAMHLLSHGGALIDTPGMRELGLVEADVDTAFSDVENFAKGCKFSDCTHKEEPHCAVKEAVSSGALSMQRLRSYHKLKEEAPYEGLSAREIDKKKVQRMFGGKKGMKRLKDQVKKKNL